MYVCMYYPVYTIQPVVKPVVQPVPQTSNRLSNVERTATVRSTGCQTGCQTGLTNDNRLNVCIHDTTGVLFAFPLLQTHTSHRTGVFNYTSSSVVPVRHNKTFAFLWRYCKIPLTSEKCPSSRIPIHSFDCVP